jgi:CRP-like cAMP-binding protein
MLVVETIAKIRRAYFAQNKPIKTISRELRVSPKVVRKVIRSQATEFRYERSRQARPVEHTRPEEVSISRVSISISCVAIMARVGTFICRREAEIMSRRWESIRLSSRPLPPAHSRGPLFD